ncbi:MAG: hypothetical protein ABW212_13060 [Pseudonocardia sediminis]
MARVVAVLADAGIFRPQVPDPRLLEQAVADHGEPVTVQAVLAALHEADYWNPGFRFDDHTAALAFHDSHVEQDPGSLRHQIDDLARLVGGEVEIVAGDVDVEWADGVRAARTRVTLTVGGERLALDYRGAAKQLSTVIPVAVARTLRSLPDGRRPTGRLAWLWSDQGVWITVLPTGVDLARLDADLGDLLEAGAGWEWVDEQEPMGACDET